MIVIITLLMTVLMGFGAIAMDSTVAYYQKSSLQTALDAGVLAGAALLPDTAAAATEARKYIVANGFSADDVTITFEGGNMVINASVAKKENPVLGAAIGKDGLNYAAGASAEKYIKTLGGPFDYLLFTGDPNYKFTMGGRFNIGGSIHSNGSFSASPAFGTVEGAIEAGKTISVNQWTMTWGSLVPGAPYIDMVDFGPVVDEAMPDTYGITMTSAEVAAKWWKQEFVGDVLVTGNCNISNQCTINGNLYVEGNLTINGGAPVCVLNGNIYATGDVTFNNSVVINGCVFAGRNINFSGGCTMVNSSSTVCVHSETGNINFNMAGTEVHGVVYAPKGDVKVVGNATFVGSIIGKTISGIPANFTARAPTEPFSFLKGEEGVRLIR